MLTKEGERAASTSVGSVGHGSKIKKSYRRGRGHADEFHALDFPGPFGLGFTLGAEVAIDDRHMAERWPSAFPVVMNSGVDCEAESFMHTLKAEEVDGKAYRSRRKTREQDRRLH